MAWPKDFHTVLLSFTDGQKVRLQGLSGYVENGNGVKSLHAYSITPSVPPKLDSFIPPTIGGHFRRRGRSTQQGAGAPLRKLELNSFNARHARK
eukprot:g5293.t1